ncbi:uncharacterized protein PFL1_00353 [Pseudozyma flocculosa PF-1]|uniref:Probable purine permease n=1 Tax=Pseudozyma flocculosa TaxID=84751 RepID=A0A5C3ETA8_9BASI|nr:uncharacterized protein PFL1_00353 [Pseudozyma flocculosa PF-1]EPQ32156.1 hypothetical protein PFL1_00353 [Pseudozyma flocculosa PF-1]SPO34905.1 probable purine permease [Pseudozyma flocculosa]
MGTGNDEKAMISVQPLATEQPSWQSAPAATTPQRDAPRRSARQPGVAGYLRHLFSREAWLGDYDFGTLCMPRLRPWARNGGSGASSAAPFYGVHDDLPITLAAICGFQHALAMLGGLITPPILIASAANLPSEQQSYLISASLITSGILSAIQMSAIPLPFGRQLGTGLLSVVGTSFATLSTATSIIDNLYKDGTCPVVDGVRQACPEAYGYILGTSAVCSLLEIFLALLPPRVLRRMFPPVITGVVVMLIGINLIGDSALPSFGGGSACQSTDSPCPLPRSYLWGDAHYLGLAFFSFITIIIVEIFGSPAMRNASIILGLLLPLAVAGPLGYMSGADIKSAKAITFLWVETFPLKVYGPAVLPLLAVYVALMMEAIGDITATSEVSKVEVEGPNYDRRISGGVLADGIGGLLSALLTITPLSVFAQNNGVIAITRCANVRAGRWTSFWLILFGIIGKLAGCVLEIPAPVLGGVLLFLFSSILVSGLRVVAMVKFTRRVRFVLATSFSLGMTGMMADGLWERLFTYGGDNKALRGFLDSIVIVLSTPFLLAAIAGIVANLILPRDPEDDDVDRESYRDEEDKVLRA